MEAVEIDLKSGALSIHIALVGFRSRLLETVTKKAQYSVVSISIFYRFSVDDRRKRIKKCTFT